MIERKKTMLNLTIEKGIMMGESPYMILSTNEPLKVSQVRVEDFILDERSQEGTLFITPTDQDVKVGRPVNVITTFLVIGAEGEKIPVPPKIINSDNQIGGEKTKFTKTDFERALREVSRKTKK